MGKIHHLLGLSNYLLVADFCLNQKHHKDHIRKGKQLQCLCKNRCIYRYGIIGTMAKAKWLCLVEL